jgi:carbon storage regulator
LIARGTAPLVVLRPGPIQFPCLYKEGAMLVLTRRRDEAIVIHNRFGKEIRLTVIAVQGSKVRLGIEAPADVSIARKELPVPQLSVETYARELAWI